MKKRSIRHQSSRQVAGRPLISVAFGADASTGEDHGTARGIIAIGDRAEGFLALGGDAKGVIALGGRSQGFLAMGGIARGVVAMGGVAFGGFTLGGVAVGLIALGGAAVGRHSYQVGPRVLGAGGKTSRRRGVRQARD